MSAAIIQTGSNPTTQIEDEDENDYEPSEPSALHERLQSLQRLVPLLRNALEIRLKLFQRFRSKLKQAFPSNADTLNYPGIFEYSKMLSDGLPR
jgi:hypothetical protein